MFKTRFDLAQHRHSTAHNTARRVSMQLQKLGFRFEWRCTFCNGPMTPERGRPNTITREHILPRAQGGTNRKDNIAASCSRCNSLRHVMNVDAFRRLMRGEPVTRAELWPDLFEE